MCLEHYIFFDKAAIILTRWIYEYGANLMSKKMVVELGSGVGLPGIVASRFADTVYLTDYIQTVLDNLRYNVQINTSESSFEDDEQKKSLKQHMLNACKVMYLNWYDIDFLIQKSSELEKKETVPDLVQQANADIRPEEFLQQLPGAHCVDLLLGSELTYTASMETISHLAKLVDFYLKPDGVFVEILSTDRDGVALFCEEIGKYNFVYLVHKVPEKYIGNFKTKQRPEEYRFYVFTRKQNVTSEYAQLVCATFGSPPENI